MEKQVKIFSFLKQRNTLERLDVLPFIALHSILILIFASFDIHYLLKVVLAAIMVLIQLVVFFSKFWSESLRARICFREVPSIDTATHVKVDVQSQKFKMINRTSICQIIKKPELNLTYVQFEKVNYVYNYESLKFEKIDFNIKIKVKEFLDFEAHKADSKSLGLLKEKFGSNTMKIPIPSFFSLYKEHIVAPFFVFQLFCILLWVFDDYGIQSAMTLLMLCVFEATVVGQRIMNLVTLRKMRVPPHFIHVYRNNKWERISSAELLPGDIVSVVEGTNYEAITQKDEDESGNLILQFMNKLKEIKKKNDEIRRQRSVNTVISQHRVREPSPLTCDMLLLSGSAIVNEAMLTGESIPQIKNSLMKIDNEYENELDYKAQHKNSVLFAGTKVVKSMSAAEENDALPPKVSVPPPDRGCICLVLKTGFSTSQGKLLRTVMYSSERTQGDSRDAFIFIFFLLIIAIAASYYVLIEGIKREGEITYKLLLRCIIIITSVVPAELPIELSLAINNSLFFLQSKRIVCIEPFRIPFAGKIDFCCFDKTGTLTKDEFIMRGVVKTDKEYPISAQGVDEDTHTVLIACNSLLQISGKTVGDPIELAIFKSSSGTIEPNGTITSNRKCRLMNIRRYAFDANLKRMSCLMRYYPSSSTGNFTNRVLSKGAPEVMRSLLKEIPEKYDYTFNLYAKKGYRILALAYKDDDSLNMHSKRDEVESNLIFCGFVIVETPLKKNTENYILELVNAKYEVCIITGDHHLTTAKVAQDLKIGPDQIAFLKVNDDNRICFIDLDGNEIQEFNELIKTNGNVNNSDGFYSAYLSLSTQYTLGITGKEMDKLQNDEKILPNKHNIFALLKLFCRVSPGQKDDIVKLLIKAGKNPSMCGDGSNDVGALKRAVIGIALLNSEETKEEKEKPFSIFSLDDDNSIKSGDVTAAAPFTSKSGSIKCIKNIFIQGRCTLVVTFQMFKILALNCLLSAYALSILALKGVKYSDYQSTYMGFVVAFYFLMLSKAEPLKKLNQNKPPYTIFSISSIISIIGQALTHLCSLFLILQLTHQYDAIKELESLKSLDDPFEPTLINTVMFIFSIVNQTINFVVNYQGEPFMQSLFQNKWLVRLSGLIIGLTAIVIFDLSPELASSLELIQLPEDTVYRLSFLGILVVDFIVCYLFENWKKIFGFYKI